AARRGDDRGRHPARSLPRGLDAAGRADDARHGAPPARRGHPPGRAPGAGDLARRHDDQSDPGARARRRAGGVPERDSGRDGAVARVGRGRGMTLYGVELTVCADAEQVASVVADELVAAARDGASIALTGGSTPGRAYELCAEREGDWSAASLWWGDERCVPPDDERSNFRLARETLLDRLEAAPREVQRIRGELAPEQAPPAAAPP